MAAAIDFYFDFSSPYGYLAATKVDALAARHGRTVAWRPMLLGVAFKTTGGQPLPMVPLKGDYSRHDFIRSARFHGIPYRQPTTFPISGVTPTRAFYWQQGSDPAKEVALAQALLRAYFTEDVNISSVDGVLAVAATLGIDADALTAGINDPAIKDRTRAEVEAAIARGVFGSPFMVVDGEPFWGMDRLDQMERWLATGGF
ncbi:MAG: 2-hydroxychromene-2-carboxylate isomerase [Betaproteobacteria bacterium]|nr:2-hydroxychromene-2-carboxylate isomerase [Betaproteobacteria bacterium]